MNENYGAVVQQRLDGLTKPLREELLLLEVTIEQAELELNELKKTRTNVKRTLALLDPVTVPKKNNVKSKQVPASNEMITRTQTWLEANPDKVSNGFTATDLERLTGRMAAQSTFSKVLNTLHDQGFIRLDRHGRGGSNIYKVVA